MATVITSNISNGLILVSPGDSNPVIIDPGISVSNTGAGVYGNGAYSWSITNAGAISGNGTNGVGVFLYGANSLTNAAGGSIYGGSRGIFDAGGALTLINNGVINGAATYGAWLRSGGSVTNAGTGAITGGALGVLVTGAGYITNATSALISGTAYGIYDQSGTGTVTNAGTISNGPQRFGAAVLLASGGSVSNQGVAANIDGTTWGVLIAGAAGTVVNQGTIKSTANAFNYYTNSNNGYVLPRAAAGVDVVAGGSVTNQAGGSIEGLIYGVAIRNAPAILSNAGTILGTGQSVASVTNTSNTVIGHLPASGVYLGGSTSVGGGGVLTNATSAVIGGLLYGVVERNGGLSATNAGSIFGNKAGILAESGGNITNNAPGRISSTYYGVQVLAAAGTVFNSGSIVSTNFGSAAGVSLPVGGSVTNATNADISATFIGVWIGGFYSEATTNGTVLNSGTISADDGAGHGAGVWIRSPSAYVLNGTGGSIHGGLAGLVFYQQTTIVNLGAISGPSGAIEEGTGVAPAANVSLRLEEAPTASLSGGVFAPSLGANNSANVLELLSGSSTGTISGFGTSYQNFGLVALDAGANWVLGGTVTSAQTIAFAGTAATGALTLANPASVNGTITGFGSHETIVLAGITDVSRVSLSTTGNVLSVYQNAGPTLTLKFDPSQTFDGTFLAATVGGATDINVSCFAAGTMIRTSAGPVAVEHLRAGLLAETHRGGAAEIVWVGHRSIDCRRHPDPAAVCPVRVRADAFGPGLPVRDLVLSPDHAVFVEDVLIPVRYLIDGVAIRQETVAHVDYYHIELPEHDVILAEDLPVESYLDTGDRAQFANGGGVVTLFPDFSARAWEMAGCAPLVRTGPVLEKVKRSLAEAATSGRRKRRQQ